MFDAIAKSTYARRVGFVTALAVLLVAIAVALAPSDPPKLFIQDIVDLGICDIGSHRFELTVANRGGQILQVGRIAMNSSCNCDAAEVSAPILPRACGQLFGRIRIRAGVGSTEFVIYSNDPRGPHPVRVQWYGKGPPALVPSEISGTVMPNMVWTQNLRIVFPRGADPVFNGTVPAAKQAECSLSVKRISSAQDAGGIQADLDRYTQQIEMQLSVVAPDVPGDYLLSPSLRFEQGGIEHIVTPLIRIAVVNEFYSSTKCFCLEAASPDALVGRSTRGIIVAIADAPHLKILRTPDFIESKLRQLGDDRVVLQLTVVSPPERDIREFDIVIGTSTDEKQLAVRGKLVYPDGGTRAAE